jgi:hypothetical protein
MGCRRIVTGHDARGNAIFLDDRVVDPVTVSAMPGFETHELWATTGTPTVPHSGPLSEITSYFPPENGTILRMITFPPTAPGDGGIDTSEPALAEIATRLPGLLEHLEPDAPGMHTTDSIDYGIVLAGEIELELDNGARTLLRAGDCVVQNGTRHAWRNHSGAPAVMAFILLGGVRR